MAAVRYFSEFGNIDGDNYRIEIIDSDYSGSSPFEFVVERGFTLTYQGDVKDPFQAIIPSKVEFVMMMENANHEALLTNLSSSAEGRYTVRIYDQSTGSNVLFWNGTILADQLSLIDEYYPRRCQLVASDDLPALKTIPFTTSSGVGYGGKDLLRVHLWQALSKVRWFGNLDWNDTTIRWSNNFVAAEEVDPAGDQFSLVQLHHSCWYNYTDGVVTSFASAYEVVEDIAKAFNCRIFQHKGIFNIVPVGSYGTFTTGSADIDFYGLDGYDNADASSTAVDTELVAGTDVFRLKGNTEILYAPHRRVEKTWKCRGDIATLQFTHWIGATGIGQDPLGTIDDGGFAYGLDDELFFNYDVRYTPVGEASDTAVAPFLKLTIKCGNYYCVNTTTIGLAQTGYHANVTTASWTTTAGYYYVKLTSGYGNWGYINLNSASLPEYFSTNGLRVLPALPADLDTLEITTDAIAYDISGTSYDNLTDEVGGAEFYVNLSFGRNNDNIGNATELTWYADTGTDNGELIYTQSGRIGSNGFGVGNSGQLLDTASGNSDPINTWDSSANASLTTNNISSLGANEILSLIRKPLEARDGELKGSFVSPLNWLYIASSGYLVAECSFQAYDKISSFTAFKIQQDLSGISVPSDPIGTYSTSGLPSKPNDNHLAGVTEELFDTFTDIDGDISGITSKTNLITITQAVNLDDVETDLNQAEADINSLQYFQTNVEAILKASFSGGGAGIYQDSSKGTTSSYVGITSTQAHLQAGSNTYLDLSETSPGNLDFYVQAGATGSEAAFKAIAIDGSSTANTATVSFNASTAGLQYSDISGTPSIPTGELVNDTTPQLGGDLDVNGKKIKSTTDVVVQVDSDNNTALSKFIIQNGAGTQVFSVDEEGTKLSTTGADNDIKIGNLDGSLGSFNGISLNGDLTYPGIVGFAGGSNQNDYFYLFGEIIDIRAGGASDASVRIEETSGNTRVVINSTFPIPQTHNFYVVGTGKFTGNVDVGAGLDVTGNITVTGTVDGIDIATDVAANTAKVGYTDAAVDLRIAAASLDDLSDVDTTTTAPTNGDALVWDNSASKWVPDGSGGSGGGGSDSFNTIQVSGQSDVVADSGNDTLTLVAGSNLAITTNATTDTITFTPSLTPTLTSATIGILLTSTGIVNSGTLSSGNTTINGTLSSGAITSSGTVQCQGINFAGAGTTTIAPVSSGAAFPDDLELSSNGNITMVLDYDSDESAQAFIVKNQAGTIIFQVDEDGISSGLFTSTTPTLATVSNFESTQTGTVTVSNYDSDVTYQVKLYNSSGTEQTSQTITDNSDGTWSITNGPILTGAYVEVLALEFGKLVSAVATSNSFNITAAATQQRYWRLQITDASKNPVHDKVAIGNFRLYTATGGGGTAYPSNMTSETTPSPYVVTKGYQYSSSYPAWKAMDGGGSSASSMWWTLGLSSANAANNWIQIDLGSSIDFGSGECQITTSGGWTDADYAVLYGSNTGDFTGEEREMAFFQNIDTSGQSGGTFTTFTESIT